MQTVETIISEVYGDAKTAADKLGVTRPAVSNWEARGHFPTRLIIAILNHASQRNIALEASEIPINRNAAPGVKAA